MTVAIGRVVDDSIVVLENIFRHVQEGGDKREAIIQGTRDVSVAIFAATVITVVVFLPLGLTPRHYRRNFPAVRSRRDLRPARRSWWRSRSCSLCTCCSTTARSAASTKAGWSASTSPHCAGCWTPPDIAGQYWALPSSRW
ncbi:MAG: efflux RND transporter permease subunit [Anaerolineae bacterium]